MILIQLFLSFFKIGCFSFGGGYAAMPLIQEQVIRTHHWMSMNTFADLVTIAEMTPGPIAVNAATFVGTQTAGISGAIAATLGCVLPSCIFVSVLAFIYTRYRKLSLLQHTLAGLRPAVVAMIAKAGVTILISAFFIEGIPAVHQVSARMILYFAAALFLLRKVKMNPVLVMGLCGVCEMVFYAAQTHLGP